MTGRPVTYEVPLGRLMSVAPGMPSADLARTADHYSRLGFAVTFPDRASLADADFAILERDGIELHFARKPEHDPARTAAWIYLRVEDADSLSTEFDVAGAGQGRGVHLTDYGVREFAHIDPDGNLLLFGSANRGEQDGDPAAADPGLRAPRPRRDREDAAAFDFATAIKTGDAERIDLLLADDSSLATSVINSCTPLHLFADAPGHRPNPAAVVAALAAAGADLDAHATGTWHHETPLHWAASNDDVELIDALLDAGADIEHPGSSINGGPPAQSALGYAQWAALRRLWQRGATTGLSHAAALGLLPVVAPVVEATPPPNADEISAAFWHACRAGQLTMAQYLLGHGANPNWNAPWSGETPLDAAREKQQANVAAWLLALGARTAAGHRAD
jgi:ankyrin repeat protein